MKQLIAAAAAVALAASLAACSGNTVEAPTQAPSQSSEAPAQPAAPETPKQNTVATFGGSVTFPDGVKVSVAQPKLVPAGQYATGDVEGQITVVTITVTNGSTEPVNAALMAFPRVTYGPSGAPAEFATDITMQFGALSTILPGETQTVEKGFGVPPAELGSVRVEVTGPSFSDFPAIFKGGQ
jgi:hypothetical protein